MIKTERFINLILFVITMKVIKIISSIFLISLVLFDISEPIHSFENKKLSYKKDYHCDHSDDFKDIRKKKLKEHYKEFFKFSSS